MKDYLKNFESLEKVLGYAFRDREFLKTALTHSSYSNEIKDIKLQDNERIEFLGDSVLNIVISDRLYKENNLPEGEMTKRRAAIVCESALERCAAGIDLGKYLLLGKGEALSGGRARSSILADAFESLIGAIYLDGGLEAAASFIGRTMSDVIEKTQNGNMFIDYKTLLQELVQSHHAADVVYEIILEEGPDHNKTYTSRVTSSEDIIGVGNGKTKKEAEQNAARNAIENINKAR
jgi:ribonuclease-3